MNPSFDDLAAGLVLLVNTDTSHDGGEHTYLLGWEEDGHAVYMTAGPHDDLRGVPRPDTLEQWTSNFCNHYGAWKRIPLATPLVTNFCANCDAPIWEDDHYLCSGCRP